MGLFSQKSVDRKININEGYVLDRPKADVPLIDVTKSVSSQVQMFCLILVQNPFLVQKTT